MPLCPSTLKNIIIFSVNIIMEKIPTIPFSENTDIDKLESFREKLTEKKKKEEKQVKEEKDNIPYYSYNCNFLF
jgi:hypothetical protein